MASEADLLALLAIAKVPVSINAAALALDISAAEVIALCNRLESRGEIVQSERGYALPPGAKVKVKPALAAFLSDKLAQNLVAGPAVKGRLLLEAGKAEEAWAFLSEAALDREHRRHDTDRVEMIQLGLRALGAAEIEGGEAEGRLRLQLAMLHRWAGRSGESAQEIETAVRLLSGEELVNALGFAAAVADDRQHPQAAERWVAMAESVAASMHTPAKLGSLLTFHGRELSRLGFATEASAALERGEALLDLHGSPAQRYYGRLNRAWLEFDQGQVARAEAGFAYLVEETGSLEGEASLAANLASWARTLFASGRPDRGQEVAAQALELAARSESRAAEMLARMAEAEGALLFDMTDAALLSAGSALEVAMAHLPAWENATRYLKARALASAGRTDEARAELELAQAATPPGGNGLRWRSRIEAFQLELSEVWNRDRAADLTDRLLQSNWLGAAVELMIARATQERDTEVAADAAALAMQIGNSVLAAKAIHAGKLWADPVSRGVASRLRTLPPGWEPALMSEEIVTSAIASSATEIEDDDLLLSRIEQAMASAGLSGDLVLSPAQRRAAGLHLRRRRPRRPGWQLAVGAAAVAALAIGSAAVTANLLAPPPAPTVTTAAPRPSTTLVAAIEDTVIPPPEDRLSGIYPVRGGTNRAGISVGGFSEVTGYYWRQTPGGRIVTSAVAYGPYVYFGTDEAIVYGLEMQTGVLNLRVLGDGPIASELAVGQTVSPTGEESSPILSFATTEGVALGYDALRSGPAIWRTPIGRARGAPLITGDKVIFATGEGVLHALELTSGREMWTFDTDGESFGSAPAEAEGVVYAVARDGFLYLVDAETGESRCDAPVELTGSAVASPVILSGAVFVGLESPPGVHVFGAGSCGVPTSAYSSFYPASTSVRLGPALTAETMYMIEERNLLALSLDPSLWTDPTELPSPWEGTYSTQNLITTAPVLAENLIYIGTQDGLVVAADAPTGTEAWRFSAGAALRGEILVVPGAVLATTAQGELVVIAGE